MGALECTLGQSTLSCKCTWNLRSRPCRCSRFSSCSLPGAPGHTLGQSTLSLHRTRNWRLRSHPCCCNRFSSRSSPWHEGETERGRDTRRNSTFSVADVTFSLPTTTNTATIQNNSGIPEGSQKIDHDITVKVPSASGSCSEVKWNDSR